MSKKESYEPHRALYTKAVPSATDYSRRSNENAINEELDMLSPESDFYSEQYAEEQLQKEMYEHGFHFEMPENF